MDASRFEARALGPCRLLPTAMFLAARGEKADPNDDNGHGTHCAARPSWDGRGSSLLLCKPAPRLVLLQLRPTMAAWICMCCTHQTFRQVCTDVRRIKEVLFQHVSTLDRFNLLSDAYETEASVSLASPAELARHRMASCFPRLSIFMSCDARCA